MNGTVSKNDSTQDYPESAGTVVEFCTPSGNCAIGILEKIDGRLFRIVTPEAEYVVGRSHIIREWPKEDGLFSTLDLITLDKEAEMILSEMAGTISKKIATLSKTPTKFDSVQLASILFGDTSAVHMYTAARILKEFDAFTLDDDGRYTYNPVSLVTPMAQFLQRAKQRAKQVKEMRSGNTRVTRLTPWNNLTDIPFLRLLELYAWSSIEPGEISKLSKEKLDDVQTILKEAGYEMATADDADKFLVSLDHWKHPSVLPRHQFDCRNKFPSLFMPFTSEEIKAATDVVAQVEKRIASASNDGTRRDLRHLKVYSVDTSGATILDDGISVETVVNAENGQQEDIFYVHIADPTEFISKGSVLEQCARMRVETMYFPQDVAWMLPLNLLRALSLSSYRDSLALTLAMKLVHHPEDGTVSIDWYEFFPSLISKVQKISFDYLDSKFFMGGLDPAEQKLYTFSRLLYNTRKARDAINNVDTPSSDLVKEFMLLANEVASRLGSQLPTKYVRITSPLRRYTDMVSHMQIKAFISQQNPPFTNEELFEISNHVSKFAQETSESAQVLEASRAMLRLYRKFRNEMNRTKRPYVTLKGKVVEMRDKLSIVRLRDFPLDVKVHLVTAEEARLIKQFLDLSFVNPRNSNNQHDSNSRAMSQVAESVFGDANEIVDLSGLDGRFSGDIAEGQTVELRLKHVDPAEKRYWVTHVWWTPQKQQQGGQ
eukprot:GEZU01023651.1.p1 GENE.GEZU01023651.1~~GEZU01023651.1.p1  ORF type:complete len:831 (-),score=147.17 GEZU01023651.1:109-2250(-)